MEYKLEIVVIMLLAFVISACSSGPGMQSGIEISDVWARPSQMMAGNGAVYMDIDNGGNQSDRLVSASSAVADFVEIHQTTMVDDVMKMQQVDGIEIPANGSVSLEPGGYHIMLINLVEEFKPGDTFSVTLDFDQAGEMIVDVTVQE